MVNRYGDPKEVAYLVKFLISDEADFINNTVIRIDGGLKEAVRNFLTAFLFIHIC